MTRAELLALARELEWRYVRYGDHRLWDPKGHHPLVMKAAAALRALAREQSK